MSKLAGVLALGGERAAVPGRRQERGGGLAGGDRCATFVDGAQEVQRGQHVAAVGGAGAEGDDAQQPGQEPADGGVAVGEFVLEVLVGFAGDLADHGRRGVDRGDVHRLDHQFAHIDLEVGQGGADGHPGVAQHDRGGVEFLDGAQPILAGPVPGGAHEVAHQQVEHLDRLVSGDRPHGGGERDERGQPAFVGQLGDGLRAGGLGEAGQGGDPATRHTLQVPVLRAELAQVDGPFEGFDQAGAADVGGAAAQPVQFRDTPAALGHQDCLQDRGLSGGGDGREQPQRPRRGAFSDCGHEAFEDADAGQQDTVFHQPVGGQVE